MLVFQRRRRRSLRRLELIQVVEQALLLQRLLYLPRVDAPFEVGVRDKVCGGEGLAADRADWLLLQPLQHARSVERVAVFGLDLGEQVTRRALVAAAARTGCFITLPLRAQQNSGGTSVHAASAAPRAALGFSSATTAPAAPPRAESASACCCARRRRCSFLNRRAATSSTENVAPLESTTTVRRAWMEGSGPSASTTMP